MDILIGLPALSSFRLDQLGTDLGERLPGLRSIAVDSVYLIDHPTALSRREQDLLVKLLDNARPHPLRAAADESEVIERWVVPRPGTVSPWSTKATDILQNSGLTKIRRIEHGRRYRLVLEHAPHGDVGPSLDDRLHDPLTEAVMSDPAALEAVFRVDAPRRLRTVPVLQEGEAALDAVNQAWDLALSPDEIAYLAQCYRDLGRDATDVELMMFAQANSEHCRHKIFNADWTMDGEPMPRSLFGMIRETARQAPTGLLSAYHDNAAVIAGSPGQRFFADPHGDYLTRTTDVPILIKVETHNHPTAISPYPGAATGVGGEIRDEAATGRGARYKAGICGFAVADLHLPDFPQPWETERTPPGHLASARAIMVDGPLGAAGYHNEFGRPTVAGFFRTLERGPFADGTPGRAYFKPIMLGGGLGNILPEHVEKARLPVGALVVVLGGPGMRIGLGGGAASSRVAGTADDGLDFASVQRDNAEMQRRAQEVIDRCWALGETNPILAIHDVGAGGLSNALPELVHGGGRGGHFELRDIPSAEPGLSPLEIWCNEAQERYVLALDPNGWDRFEALCTRERCPMAIVGKTTEDLQLTVTDRTFPEQPVDLPLRVLFGHPPRMQRAGRRMTRPGELAWDPEGIPLEEAVDRVLRLPAVADKSFLITIGDRSVGGLVAREPMVGPWQVPVADVGVTATDFEGPTGEAIALGERPGVAMRDAAASARLAVGEALTNLAAAPIAELSDVKLSANWMAAAGDPADDAELFDAVQAVAEHLCPRLGIAIPVGKDSLSMRTRWSSEAGTQEARAPLSLVVTAVAPVTDIRRVATPELKRAPESRLLLLDLGGGQDRLGGSALAYVYGRVGARPPDIDDPDRLAAVFRFLQRAHQSGHVLAYHDRADGGLIATLLELAFAGHAGLEIALPADRTPMGALFSEELGVVLQVAGNGVADIEAALEAEGLMPFADWLGSPRDDERIRIEQGGRVLFDAERGPLHRRWSETSYHLQAERDDPICAREAWEAKAASEPGLHLAGFDDPPPERPAPASRRERPAVAILREQGVNGHVEMAAAFERAGFRARDIHMTDLLTGRENLADCSGLAVCGGFSYGDVLGAGGGWAKVVLNHPQARAAFSTFFARPDTFTLGVCNGCQMLTRLRPLIPGSEGWPRFVRNRSEQFEARFAQVEVLDSPSILLRGLIGVRLPVPVAHGEGRVAFADATEAAAALTEWRATLRYVDGRGEPAETYPANPNGSPGGMTGFTNRDGRVTLLMPHPERAFRWVQWPWRPRGITSDNAPWFQLFHNARSWVDSGL